jgi:signal peptidase II
MQDSESSTIPLSVTPSVWSRMAVIVLATIVLDQLTKWLIVTTFAVGDLHPVIPNFFNLTLTYNPGAAFGFFSQLPDGTRQLVLMLATVAAFGVIALCFREYASSSIGRTAIALIVGGAFGNLTDRMRYGQVVDFLDFYIGNFHWPAFNVADSAICIGVMLLLIRR